jgi:hypothetical protein
LLDQSGRSRPKGAIERRLVLGRYKDAIGACEKAGTSDDSWAVQLFLVAAYGDEGEVAKAEAAKAALLRRRPGFSIADLNQGEL